MKMPPPGCRHVYQRKPNRKPGSGLSIQPVYFLNPHTCHVFLSDIITQVQKCQIKFLYHSSYTKISLCMQSGQYKPALPPLLPSRCEACGNMSGPCVAPKENQAVAYLGHSCAIRQVWILSGLDLLAGKCSRSVISILPAVILPLYQFSHAGFPLYNSPKH